MPNWQLCSSPRTEFVSSTSKATSFKNKVHRFMHHVISRSICGRFESSGKVNHVDMPCLYGMLKKVRVHMGVILAKLLLNQHSDKVRTMFLGPYVTRIVRNSQLVHLTRKRLGNSPNHCG
nr:probable leucine-rich repeat receptor-like protein kinase At1g35710 [Ipomoea batatas]